MSVDYCANCGYVDTDTDAEHFPCTRSFDLDYQYEEPAQDIIQEHGDPRDHPLWGVFTLVAKGLGSGDNIDDLLMEWPMFWSGAKSAIGYLASRRVHK